MTTKLPVTTAAVIVWAYWTIAHGLVRNSPKSESRSVPPTISWPTGCCMKEFVTRMKYPESQLPTNTPIAESMWSRAETRPLAEDENTNESALQEEREHPSIARVWPMTRSNTW